MYDNWIIAKGSSIGGRHIEDNTPCQDANNVFYDSELNYGIAVVSDGAGSASNSEKGSEFIVDKIVDIIKNKFDKTDFDSFLESDKQEIDMFFIRAFKELHEQLEEFAKSTDLPIKSLAATLILVLFSKSGLICSHIGDGRAGFQDMEGNWFPILVPYRGEEANQTIFLTSDIWGNPQEFVRTTVVRQLIQSFTLMSDGSENATFELNRFNEETQMYEQLNNPYPKFFNPNVNVLRELHKSGKTTIEIDELWASFLKNGNEKFESEIDDKTLILGTLIDKDTNA
jgi:hypothetical protein